MERYTAPSQPAAGKPYANTYCQAPEIVAEYKR
jgi:hypothetical protein